MFGKTSCKLYAVKAAIGHACVDEDKGGNKENLYNFFNMMAGGLAGETPHMICVAVKGIARLTYEFTDLISRAFNVLPSAFLFLQRKSREINKANLGLLKVKLLLEMLVKKCGLEAVKEVIPEEHMKLLTNIRKVVELSGWNHTKIFSDFGDEETDNGNSDDMDTKTFSGHHSLPNIKISLH
ncbi:hypothetical protein Tco_0294054, partial [Tanacetum coccineum]